MSIEAYQHHGTTESIAPSELSVAQHLSEEERAALQAVIDTRPSKPLLLPQSMQEVMHTLDTGEEGEPTTAGRVIAIRKYAQEKLARSKGTQAETSTETEVEVPTHTNAPAKHRRSYSDAGASPYATGDGMIRVSKGHVDIQGGGMVTSGTRGDGKSRRATRESTSLPVAELIPEKREFQQQTYSNGVKHFYVAGKDGKKRHISAASILADYGHAGDFQGKRPIEAAADTDTTSANDDDLVMPATYRDQAAWDKKTDAEKRRIIAIDDMIAADEAERRSSNTSQPLDRIRAEQKTLENDPIYQRIVAKVEADANAKIATLADYYDGDITAISKMTPGQRLQIFRKASQQAKIDGKELLVMPESYGGTKLMSDFYAMSKDKQRRVIRTDKLITQDRIEQAERYAAMGKQKRTLHDLGYSALRAVDDGFAALAKRYHETDKSKRRKAVVGLLAASVALTGIGLGHNKDEAPSKAHSTTVSLNKPHDVAGRRAALTEIHLKNLDDTKKDVAIEKARSVKLHAGDTIWDESKVHLTKGGNRHPSNAQVTEEMHRVMQLNHINEDEARHLAVGTNIKF